jgi:Flp pilus assembly protein TadG
MYVWRRRASSDQVTKILREFRGRLYSGDEQGGALVETAVCLPILLALLMGMASFGITLNNYISLTNGVDLAARQLSISAGQTADPCLLGVQTFENSAPSLNTSKLGFTFVFNGTSESGANALSCTGAAAKLTSGTSVQVTATYPCSISLFGLTLPSCALSAQTSELTQ